MSAVLADARLFDVSLPGDRILHAYEAGDPAGQLVVSHHGTPMSGVLGEDWSRDAQDRGIRLVGFDRAGYGGSTRHKGRRVADVAADVAGLADALGAQRFFTWGMSGGGPHSLACAALLGERVIAAASIASVAPYDAAGLDFLKGMGQDNLDEFGAALEGSTALRAYLADQRADLLAASPEDMREVMASLLPEVDKAVLTGETAEFLHEAMVIGLRDDSDGWLDDDLAFVAPWGFDVASIKVPLMVIQGEQDLMVPFAHGRWIAGQLPASTVDLSADEGHLSLLARIPDVHAWLLEQA